MTDDKDHRLGRYAEASQTKNVAIGLRRRGGPFEGTIEIRCACSL